MYAATTAPLTRLTLGVYMSPPAPAGVARGKKWHTWAAPTHQRRREHSMTGRRLAVAFAPGHASQRAPDVHGATVVGERCGACQRRFVWRRVRARQRWRPLCPRLGFSLRAGRASHHHIDHFPGPVELPYPASGGASPLAPTCFAAGDPNASLSHHGQSIATNPKNSPSSGLLTTNLSTPHPVRDTPLLPP